MIVAALTACSPVLVWYSQEARSYALLVLLSAASLLAFAYVLERPTGRSAAAWVICSALALATHYYALLAVVPEALWLLAVHRRSRAVQVSFARRRAVRAGADPARDQPARNGQGQLDLARPPRPPHRRDLPPVRRGFTSVAYSVLEPLALALAIFGLVLLVLRSDPGERVGGLIAASLAIAGLVLGLVLVAGGFDDLLTRNMLPIWMAAAVAVAARVRSAARAARGCLRGRGAVRDRGGLDDRDRVRSQLPATRLARRGAGARRRSANTRERSVEIRDAVGNIGYPVDVIVMWTERFERTKRVIGGIAYPANKYGRVIYAAA